MSNDKKTVGIYGGSFDPPHFGHLNLATEMLEKCQLQEIWFVPACTNPHKLNTPPLSTEHRLAMLDLALEGQASFKINDMECQRQGSSYTIDTLKMLITPELEKTHLFYLILGEDSIPGFFHWHQPEEIVKLVSLLIGYRASGPSPLPIDGNPLIIDAIRKGMIPTNMMDISSTEVRNRLQQQKYCQHLVPHSVLKYIQENKLYSQN